MKKLKSISQSRYFMLIAIVLGISFRFLVATMGHNYDFDSFLIVADIVDRGGNVYASTARYNYGPVWSYILKFIYHLALKDKVVLRYLLVTFLSLVDVGIFVILWQKRGKAVAYLFFLNPISIIITGYHSQFDNLAILLAMFSVILLGDDFNKPITNRKFLGLSTLGLSLATKHIFFVFPFWLAVKQKGALRKIMTLLVPACIFLLSFATYWNAGKQGIIKHVFLYHSWNNEYFYKWFVPMSVQLVLTSRMAWISLLIIFAFILRRKSGFESLLVYTCVLVAASPAITNQYLAVAVPFVAANLNPFALMYTAIGTWYLLLDSNGLHISELQRFAEISRNGYYAVLVSLLSLALIWSIWREQLTMLMKRIFFETKVQLGYEE